MQSGGVRPSAECQGLLHETLPHPVLELRTSFQVLQRLPVDVNLRLQIFVLLPQFLVDVQFRDFRKEQKGVLSWIHSHLADYRLSSCRATPAIPFSRFGISYPELTCQAEM